MEFRNIFVVFDPTRPNQPALERAAIIAAEVPSELHVFVCIYSELDKGADKSAQIRKLIAEQQATLDRAVAPLLEKGIVVTTEVEWDKDWYKGVLRASISNNADVVLKSSYRHSQAQRILNKTSDWTLIRECLCPVLLVKETEVPQNRKVLAAVDIRPEKGSYDKLNQQIIDFSRQVMDRSGPGAEIHFVNAFDQLKAVPDRNALIKNCGVSSDRIHIQMGNPEEVIVQRAKAIDASLVVVGNAARTGVSAMINGNTVEKVLDKLDCDVLSIP